MALPCDRSTWSSLVFLPYSMTPSVKVEKIHPKIDGALLKPAVGPTCSSTVSSSIKTGLNPSIPKPPLPSPGQILNGKGLLSVPPYLEKKQDESTNNRKIFHKKLSGNFSEFVFIMLILKTQRAFLQCVFRS